MVDDFITRKYSTAALVFYGNNRELPDTPCAPAQADVLAAERALSSLRPEVFRAVEAVYFGLPERPHQGEISARVTAATFELNYCERSLWGFLCEARVAFARERGLRLG